jgi:hypothetical protein
MTVAELITLLQQFPQDLPVAYAIDSEQCLLEKTDLGVVELDQARPDGWVHNKRGDRRGQKYLVFLGN